MLFMAATKDDEYRKPSIHSWTYFLSTHNKDQIVDMERSFYCGDAAGRPAEGTKKKDFSDTDLKYALNIGLSFKLPEELFLGQKSLKIPAVKPSGIEKFFASTKNSSSKEGKDEETKEIKSEKTNSSTQKQAAKKTYTSEKQELIVFCGAPGSGKSTFWKNYLKDYVRVNNDQLKTKEKCAKVCDEALSTGKRAVIDNTNKSKEERSRYTSIAKKYKVPVRCFLFDIPKEVCMHNNSQRATNPHREHLSSKVPAIPIHSWFKNLEKPALSEGFTEIVSLKFDPVFENDQDEQTYKLY